MKKFKLILYLLCILCFVSLTSCNKVSKLNNNNYGKIKYYVAGLYIQVDEYDEFSMDDANPKIYFDFSNTSRFGTLSTKSGAMSSAVNITDIAKDNRVEDEINKYYMIANIKFVNSDVKKIRLYLIYIDNNGEFSVNEEVSEKVDVSKSTTYNFVTEFTNNKNKYQIQMQLNFKK